MGLHREAERNKKRYKDEQIAYALRQAEDLVVRRCCTQAS